MAATVQALRVAPPRSPERTQLAAAIARRDALVKSAAKIRDAHETAEQTCWRATDRLKAAEAARDQAKTTEGARLAAVTLGEATDLPSLADAELAVTQASNDLQIARATRDALKQRIEVEQSAVRRAEAAIHDAVRAVMKCETEQLVADLEAAQQRVIELSCVASALSDEQVGPISEWGVNLTKPRPELNETAQAWRSAVQALHGDADAELPL